MKSAILIFFTFSIVVFSCKEKNKQLSNNILNQNNLKNQSFYIDINKDTTLVSKSGCVIKIQKNTFTSDSDNIKLEVKEAITNTDIVLAGLTTMSGKNSLASGGMMYFNTAKGYSASINKNIEVLIPTKDYNPNMDVFKGVEENGKIDWQEPKPLPKDSTIVSIENGKNLFKANCANCHYPHKDFTGPALQGVTKRATKQWIYDFIHSPLKSNDLQSIAIKSKWKGNGIMTAFPQLKNYDIDNILAYVETFPINEKRTYTYISDSTKTDSPYNSACEDSCTSFILANEQLQSEKDEIKNNESNEFFNLDRNIPIPIQPIESFATSTFQQDNLEITTVTPTSITATFYTININAFGWYNIDILQKEETNCIESELLVNIKTDVKSDFNVMLIIPSVKAFVEGGKLKNDKQYGFDELNGKIPLPKSTKGYIIAFTEINNQLFFGQTSFITKQKQLLNVTVSKNSKEEMENAIKALNLDGITANIKRNETQQKLEAIENEKKKIEQIKPINCNCELTYTYNSYPEKIAKTDTVKK